MKVLITVSYDGTDYCGWQIQSGQITVQEVVEKAISKLYGGRVKILGASRTDSGVHALAQRATFSPPDDRIPPQRMFLAINAHLPEDIRVTASETVTDDFHVINDVVRKTYVYRIRNSNIYNPIQRRFAYHVREPLNLGLMNEAAAFFLGKHDFKAFCAANSSAATTIRIIYKLSICRADDVISLEICGNGFLYNMVRIIAGTLVAVGLGKIPPSAVEEIILNGERKKAGKTLPAHGLMLVNIEY